MIPVNSHLALVRLSRTSINIVKRNSQRIVLGSSSTSVNQRRTFISIVNPDAPKIVKLRKSTSFKVADIEESEKILSLQSFLKEHILAEDTTTNIAPDAASSTTTVHPDTEAFKDQIRRREEEEPCVLLKEDIGVETDHLEGDTNRDVGTGASVGVTEDKVFFTHKDKQALRSKFLVTAKGWYLQAL